MRSVNEYDDDDVQCDCSWWLVSYHFMCSGVLRTVIPFVILTVLSGRMIVRIREMTRHFRSRRCSREQTKEVCKKMNWRRNLTVTLVAVMALFTVYCTVHGLSASAAGPSSQHTSSTAPPGPSSEPRSTAAGLQRRQRASGCPRHGELLRLLYRRNWFSSKPASPAIGEQSDGLRREKV